MNRTQQAFEAGKVAFNAGHDMESNPFFSGHLFMAWYRGWKFARALTLPN